MSDKEQVGMFETVIDTSTAKMVNQGAVDLAHSQDRTQAFCRQMLTEYDEDDLLYLVVEINGFLNEGRMTRRLTRLLGTLENSN